jgi:hypothetical protein
MISIEKIENKFGGKKIKKIEEDDLSFTGMILFIFTILFTVTILYAILFSKWLPSTGIYILDLIKDGIFFSFSF